MGIFDGIETYAERTAVVDDEGRSTSYRELVAMGEQLTATIGERCLVLMVCRNDLGSIAAYVGLQRAGHVTMLVNHKTDRAALLTLIGAFRPEYLYLPDDVSLPAEAGTAVASLSGYRLMATGQSTDDAMHADLTLLLGTSGSTGSPDYVRLSSNNLVANTASIVEYLGIDAQDRAITTMPMSYSYGLSIINTHLAQGASIVATERTLMERAFWDLLRSTSTTTFGGVPFVFQMLERLKFTDMDLPSLRYLTQAGGRLDPALIEAFGNWSAQRGIDFYVMYGQTEATARIAYVPAARAVDKAGSIGIAIPGGRIWLAGDDGRPVSDDRHSGEIVYEGANVSLGSASDRHGLSEPDANGGMLFTGDIARRDEDGYLHILGRKSRFVKVFGNRIGLDALEQLLQHAGIDAVCGGRDDALAIFITDADMETAVRKVLAEKTSIGRQAYRIRVIESIPRSDTGKVRYAALPAV